MMDRRRTLMQNNDEPSPTPLYDWDFTTSLVDSISNITAVTNGNITSNGIEFSASNTYIGLINNVDFVDKTIEVWISNASTLSGTASAHGRLVCYGTSATYATATNASVFAWRKGVTPQRWAFYNGSAWDNNYIQDASRAYFNGKRLRIYLSSDKIPTLKVSTNRKTYTPILTSATAMKYTTGFIIGSSNQDNLIGLVVSRVRIYDGDV